MPAVRLVVDGNFKAQHMRMRRPEFDVDLTNGEGYMVNETLYQDHLKTALVLKEVHINSTTSYTSILLFRVA